jgi:hypothetical protein
MTRPAAPSPPQWHRDPRTRRRLALFVVLVALAGLTIGLSLILLYAISLEQDELRRIDADSRRCVLAAAPPPPTVPAPGEPPRSQPRGTSAYIPLGTDIVALMRLELERLRPDGRLERVRLGAPGVLPPTSVHLVTLWAPWCAPCKQLLPALRDMLARRADWGRAVDFVPIQVLDATWPGEAYAGIAGLLPPTRVPLADRSQDNRLVELLRDPGRALYTGDLPTTLLLDCNRRVRWAKDGALTPADAEDLERWISRLSDQIRYREPECQQTWCGNGRCEPGEALRCEDDCGPPPPPQPPPCPADCLQCDDQGRCLAREAATGCGDRRCDPGETTINCCVDCGCKGHNVCRPNVEKRMVCGPKPLAF